MNLARIVSAPSLCLFLILLADASSAGGSARTLRVCADPNNLPFSNARSEGFENEIADLVAAELKAKPVYTWWPQRRGFVRNTLNAGRCDVIMGVPSNFELALTTRPYYRSSYVFVSRKDRALGLGDLDDPRLRTMRIGVHLIGDDYANAPPAHALSRRGMIDNLVGYSVYGDYRAESPPARLIDAVTRGEIDAAVAWGPLAGYFAQNSALPLALARVTPEMDGSVPMTFEISLAVRRKEHDLRDELNRVLTRRSSGVRAILARYGVPLL